MRRPVIQILFIAVIILAAGCARSDGELRIRVRNVSAFDYQEVRVNDTNDDHLYGDLAAGQTSAYQVYGMAYRYAFVELLIDSDTFTIQPIDFVGETPLSPGDYTYEVDAAQGGDRYGRLTMELVED